MNERIRRITSIAIVACATALSASAQITDRPRPAEWDKLIRCGEPKKYFHGLLTME